MRGVPIFPAAGIPNVLDNSDVNVVFPFVPVVQTSLGVYDCFYDEIIDTIQA